MLDTCYSAVVLRPQDLNRGKGSRTYGEASDALIMALIGAADMSGKTFVDLGSGIGQVSLLRAANVPPSPLGICSVQVCMMVAALSDASSCVGIEIEDCRTTYAAKLLSRFARPNHCCPFSNLLSTDFSHARKQTAFYMLQSYY